MEKNQIQILNHLKQNNMNVTKNDIKEIGIEYGILLSDIQINNILNEYNRVVLDKAEDWEDIVKDLFIKQITK